MYDPIGFQQILQLDSAETLVLTVNNRFARRLVIQIQQTLGQGKAIAVPDIMPLSAWLVQINDELSFHETHAPASYLLDTFSSLHLWEQIIYQQEPEQSCLIDVPQAAKSALDADRLIDEWELSYEDEEQTDDSRRFLVWREAYKQYLHDYDLDDANRATQRVLTALQANAFQSPWRHVVVVGFHEFTVRMKAMLTALQQQGVQVYEYQEPVQHETQCERIQASTPDAEWRLAAQWAATQLNTYPKGRFAIVALDLQAEAVFAHRVLAHELAPSIDGTAGFTWNIAVGRPLSEWPLVYAACRWLDLIAAFNAKDVSSKQLGDALLAGHCVASVHEKQQRANLDVRWRQQQKRGLSAQEVTTSLGDLEQLGAAWQQVQAYLAQIDSHYTPAQWVPHLRELLKCIGFPGEQNLDSHGYQVMVAFDQRLGQFARLAPVFGALTLSQVVAMLSRFLRETLFQPQRENFARLDVLGVLEAEGGEWDAVWVIGVTDAMLPAIPNPNPFIPYAVLRRVQAPRATPERELEWSYTLMNSLKTTTPQLICSYPFQNNGQLIRPSPLLLSMPERVLVDPLAQQPSMPVAFQWLQDEQGPPIAQAERVYGGSALLDRQARNPLWAFVQHRLHASALPNYEDSSRLRLWRGQFLHKSMELFWLHMQPATSARLAALHQQGQTEALLQDAIQQAAHEFLVDLPPVLSQLEQERALTVLSKWLESELQRGIFEVVALEQKHRLPGLDTNMRIDRIDQLPDGSYVLIDYKTSKINKNYMAWLRDRPIELQLPVYAAILEQQQKQVAAMAFGFLNYQVGLGGYGRDEAGLTETDTKRIAEAVNDWEGLQQHLIQQITLIRDEFLQGKAQNEYMHLDDLMFCDVLPFLRLNQEKDDESTAAQ